MVQLAAENLIKTFDSGSTVAVDDVSFEVEDNEIVALLGPSGCGKTTTLRCVAGVETPDSGKITIGGDTVYDSETGITLNPEDRDVGMVYQNYAIWPHKTVYENVVFPLKYKTSIESKGNREEQVTEALEMLQISDLRDKPATDLSGGQQQRVALARSIVHDPDLLLLDEPLSNLDKQLRTEMRDELQRIQSRLEISMLYVTHDQDEAFYLADRVMIMNHGNIIEVGKPSDLRIEPKSKFAREFIGDWNMIPGRLENGTLEVEGIGQIDRSVLSDNFQNKKDDITCFIHPREVQLDESGSEAPPGHISVTGSVIAEGVVEDHYEISVEVDGQVVKIYHDDFDPIDRGTETTFHVDPNEIKGYQ